MSWAVANLCSDRVFGSPVRKQIIMFMADKASDDGSGIWCSKGTVVRHTELGETTVKRAINEFIDEGILTETGRRKCANGYTVIYQMDLGEVERLESTDMPSQDTPSRADGVHSGTGTGSRPDPQEGPQRTPNHPLTIHKPPTRGGACEGEEDLDFEKIWEVYPEDRRRNKAVCIGHIKEVLADGLDPDELRNAVHAYAAQTDGYTRSKVSFSDNWFKQKYWVRFVEEARGKAAEFVASHPQHLARLTAWIKSDHAMCRHITKGQVDELLAANLVGPDEVQAAGLLP